MAIIFSMLFVGLVLGLVGGGGATLLLPILVYIIGIKPSLATSYTLFIIGISSLVGAINYANKKMIDYQKGIWFFIPSIITIIITRKFIFPVIPDEFQVLNFAVHKHFTMMIIFGMALIIASFQLLLDNPIKKSTAPENSQNNYASISSGVGVGFFSGLIGVGGGFFIMPSLLWFCKIPVRMAIGTSVSIIALNCIAGFLADMSNIVLLNWNLLCSSVGLTVVGMLIGSKLSTYISSQILKKMFGWISLIVAVVVIGYEIIQKIN